VDVPLLRVGWREWVGLPALDIPALKVKVDTGARTSALHTYFVEPFRLDGRERIRFGLHPLQGRETLQLVREADIVDYRQVSDSGGHREWRYVISTQLELGGHLREIEMTLTNRDSMRFRMLLGRTAMAGLLVDPNSSYLTPHIRGGIYRETRFRP
jgi:hypothetical protein